MGIINDYIQTLVDPGRGIISRMYQVARTVIPEPGEKLSYGLPALSHHNKAVVAIVATKAGFSLYPFSGKVVAAIRHQHPHLTASAGNGALKFTANNVLSHEIIRTVVELRLAEIE